MNKDILIILKCNQLSNILKEKKIFNILEKKIIINCILIDQNHFIKWIQYNIKEKKINIEKKAFFLLCKYYESNTLFIDQILNMLLITWPNQNITIEKIYKIIEHMPVFSPIHWINAIFDGNKKKALYILNIFHKQKKNPLILIRSFQKDLIKLIYIKRNKNIDVYLFLQKNKIWQERHQYFINATKNNNYNNYYKIIRILVQIEIQIKKEYDHSIWIKLKTLTLLLCSTNF